MQMMFKHDGMLYCSPYVYILVHAFSGVRSNRDRQRRQALKLLIDFEEQPGHWNEHLKTYATGVILGITFGMTIPFGRRRKYDMLGNTETLGADVQLLSNNSYHLFTRNF